MNQRLMLFSRLTSVSLGIWGCNQATSSQPGDSPKQDTAATISAACSLNTATIPCPPRTYSYLYTNYSGGPNINDYSQETTQIILRRKPGSDTLMIHATQKIHQLLAGPFVTQTGETVGFRTVDSIVLDTSYQSSRPIDSLYSRIFAPADSSSWVRDSVIQIHGQSHKISLYRRLIGGQAPEDRLVVHGFGVVAFRYSAMSRMGLVYNASWNLLAIDDQKVDSAIFNGYFNGWRGSP